MTEKLAAIKLVAMDIDGTFTDGTLYYDSDGNVMKGFSSHDGMGLELLRRAGIKRGFITGRHDKASGARAAYLGVDFFLTNIGDKSVALKQILRDFNLQLNECVFIGDDLNDLSAFEAAGVSVAVADAAEEVRKKADIITSASGGHGAIREVVNMILSAKDLDPVALWMSEKDRTVGTQ